MLNGITRSQVHGTRMTEREDMTGEKKYLKDVTAESFPNS